MRTCYLCEKKGTITYLNAEKFHAEWKRGGKKWDLEPAILHLIDAHGLVPSQDFVTAVMENELSFIGSYHSCGIALDEKRANLMVRDVPVDLHAKLLQWFLNVS